MIKKASDDEVSDIITNLLACAANQEDSIQSIEGLAQGVQFDKTYEYFFNLSQVRMKQQLHQEALKVLITSHQMAKQD